MPRTVATRRGSRFLAGVDMSMQSGLYRKHLPDLVRAGEVPEAVLNESVRKVLAMKAMLGLFEDPFRRIDEKRETARSMLPKSRALAREAGRKSIVLLKNDGDLLPLPKSGKTDRAHRPVRGRPARPRRPMGGLWHGREGRRSGDRRPRRRRGQEQRHRRRRLRRREADCRRHRGRRSPRRSRPTSSCSPSVKRRACRARRNRAPKSSSRSPSRSWRKRSPRSASRSSSC